MRTLTFCLSPLVLCLASQAAAQKKPDAILLDTSCSSIGSIVGKSDKPIVKESAKSLFFCAKSKDGFDCQMSSLSGDKYLGAGKTKQVKFVTVADTGDTLQIMMEGSLLSIYIDRNSQSYALGQMYWEAASGFLLQKQCIGVYAAGSRIDDVIKSLAR